MGLEIDVRDNRLEANKMDASTYKASGIFAKELEEELMKYTTKYEECKMDTNLVEKTEEVQRSTDVEVNILECTKSLGNEVVAAEYQDITESSSSFDGSVSGLENLDNTLDDSEALSDFRGDATSAMDFDGFGEKIWMRKKKLTTHWRSFIQPLMWRCKWVELQMKNLQSQTQQYDRELEAYKKRKQIHLEDSTLINGVKSIPFSRINARTDVLKRKKRRKNEVTMDVAAYMSRHNLFSYYENRKSFTEAAIMSNEMKNSATQKVNIDDEFWVNDEQLLSFEPGDGDNSLEHILRKIDFLQSQVVKLKSRVDLVIRENAGKFSSYDNLSLATTSNTSPPNSGDGMAVGTYIASQLMISEYSMGDVFVPEGEGTSHGDVVSDANGSLHHHACFADAYKNVEDGVLIDNERVKEEMNSFEDVMVHPIERPLVLNDGVVNTHNTPPVLREPDLPTPPKIRSISNLNATKGKRKRGRRKGGIRRK